MSRESVTSLVDLFEGSIQPVPTKASYRLGIFAVAFAMILLPVIYLALIVLTGWGVYLWATEGPRILNELSGRARSFSYLAPLVSGTVLVLFMIKPLVLRTKSESTHVTLSESDQPELYAFVRKLCGIVGAPAPKRIDVDCQVNASASFDRGWRGWFTGDLVLTIGLPLASGLTLRQLTGVLAHEFGHFAQGSGMRLTYVIRSINLWFARVVHQRDVLDRQLEKAKNTSWLWFKMMANLAWGLVWVTRQILRGLMNLGHALSCYLSRQMEFDADRYEARVAGSATFAETAERLRTLSVANDLAYQTLNRSWSEGKLADDLPAMVQRLEQTLDAEVREHLQKQATEQGTGMWDTHPADRDRVASAEREQAPGILQTDLPGSAMFRDFDALSREITAGHYGRNFGLEFTPEQLVDTADLISKDSDRRQARDRAHRLFGDAAGDLEPLGIGALSVESLPPFDADAQRAARQALETQLESIGAWTKQRSELLERTAELALATEFGEAGFTFNEGDFGVRDEHSARLERDRGLEQLGRAAAVPKDYRAALRARLETSLTHPAARPEDAPDLASLLTAAEVLESIHPQLCAIDVEAHAYVSLTNAEASIEEPQGIPARREELTKQMEGRLEPLRTALGDTADPFGDWALVDVAFPESEAEWHPVRRGMDASSRLRERYRDLLADLSGRVEAVDGA